MSDEEFTQAAICPFCTAEIGIATSTVSQPEGSMVICTKCIRPSVIFGSGSAACLVKPPYDMLIEAFATPIVTEMLAKAWEVYDQAHDALPHTQTQLADNGTGKLDLVPFPDVEDADPLPLFDDREPDESNE